MLTATGKKQIADVDGCVNNSHSNRAKIRRKTIFRLCVVALVVVHFRK